MRRRAARGNHRGKLKKQQVIFSPMTLNFALSPYKATGIWSPPDMWLHSQFVALQRAQYFLISSSGNSRPTSLNKYFSKSSGEVIGKVVCIGSLSRNFPLRTVSTSMVSFRALGTISGNQISDEEWIWIFNLKQFWTFTFFHPQSTGGLNSRRKSLAAFAGCLYDPSFATFGGSPTGVSSFLIKANSNITAY